MLDSIIAKLLTKTGIKILLTLMVAIFLSLNLEAGVEITCSLADSLDITIKQCEDLLK